MTLSDLLGTGRIQILDIGARDDIHPRWRPFLKYLEIVGFDADADECARLNAQAQGGKTFLPYALADTEGPRTFYCCHSPGSSGFFAPNTPFIARFAEDIQASMRVTQRLELPTTTLNTVATTRRLHPEAIKIDVQGAELAILKGADTLLPAVKLIEVEVEFNPQYMNQPLFADVDSYLRQQGFELLGLRRTLWRRHSAQQTVRGGQIVHGDALYYNAALLERELPRGADLGAWLLLLAAYQQDDFVAQLTEAVQGPPVQSLLAPATTSWIKRFVLRLLTRGLHNREARRLLDESRNGRAVDWHDPDFY